MPYTNFHFPLFFVNIFQIFVWLSCSISFIELRTFYELPCAVLVFFCMYGKSLTLSAGPHRQLTRMLSAPFWASASPNTSPSARPTITLHTNTSILKVNKVVLQYKDHLHIKGSRPEWCISSMIHSRDIPFWSETLDMDHALKLGAILWHGINGITMIFKMQNKYFLKAKNAWMLSLNIEDCY